MARPFVWWGAGPGMSSLKIGREHKTRKALFTRGIRRGYLTLEEIDEALPNGSMTDAERWLLFYSLHASRVEILDGRGRRISLDEIRSTRDELQGGGEMHDDSQPEHH
ncbi:MAG TPA: hypothetical protein VH083_12380 [Myxococcales bacterium]|nr:hypothetical protein [Myxococcales bacterium]